MLGSFRLARHNNISGNVRNADGAVGGVDMLTAGAAGPVSVNAQILFIYLDFDIVADFRKNVNGGK